MTQGQIRIIGGKLRGRKLTVPKALDLRPTPDRVRETLFNWLAPKVVGAHCLDAFAGSGALGFEALSRGASSVTLVDSSRYIIELLIKEAAHFKLDNAIIYQAALPEGLKRPSKSFDIVFLDPPYKLNLQLPMCFYLEQHDYLAPNASIYLEASALITAVDLPPNWEIIKNKKAGLVIYHLIRRT